MQIFGLRIYKPAKLLKNPGNFYFANLLVEHCADFICCFLLKLVEKKQKSHTESRFYCILVYM
jgi:hypothetical protein